MTAALYLGDCRELLRWLPDNSVDAIVTDPPYELGFMGHGWDASGIAYDREVWTEALRVLKPGGHAIAYGAARTYHWLACAVELAGFEIRDMVPWLQGQGMPHGIDVSKAIDKMDAGEEQNLRRLKFTAWVRSTGVTSRAIDEATGTNMGGHYTTAASQPAIMTREHLEACRSLFGDVPAWVEREADIRSVESKNFAEREIVGHAKVPVGHAFAGAIHGGDSSARVVPVTAPSTAEAVRWSGWNTQLAPGHEPAVLARKPISEPTVAANVLRWGTGALNVDACRLDGGKRVPGYKDMDAGGRRRTAVHNSKRADDRTSGHDANVGRWPPNVTLSEAAAGRLDAMVGKRKSGARTGGAFNKDGRVTDANRGTARHGMTEAWEGGPSEFFYTAKAATREREQGCEHLRWARSDDGGFVPWEPGMELLVDHRGQPIGNPHPTVKPEALMCRNVRLITPPMAYVDGRPTGLPGLVLDLFVGSGTTGVACVREGFRFLGSDMTPWAHTIARSRIRWAQGRGAKIEETTAAVGPVQGALFV